MTQKILLIVLCLGFCGSFGQANHKQAHDEFIIGPVEEISMQTEGQCVPARLMKKPMILPKQKCRLG